MSEVVPARAARAARRRRRPPRYARSGRVGLARVDFRIGPAVGAHCGAATNVIVVKIRYENRYLAGSRSTSSRHTRSD